MNRIYQGRVASISFQDSEGNWVASPIGADQSACPLWTHHTIFQDAVNYYLVALGALADPAQAEGDRVIGDLQERLAAAWERFPRVGNAGAIAPRSLRGSVGPWLGLSAKATMAEAFEAVLKGNGAEGNGVPSEALTLGLRLLLAKCSGDAAIQQGGRGYFPRFCDGAFKGSWDFSTTAQEAAVGKSRLADILHSDPTDDQLTALAAEMSLGWTVKVDPGKFFVGGDAKQRLSEAIAHIAGFVASPANTRVAEALSPFNDAEAAIRSLAERVDSLPDSLQIPRNRKANKDLTFSTLVFQYFPSRLTAAMLRLFVKAPARASALKNKSSGDVQFGKLGNDPIRISRGKREFVFRAFTAIPAWNPSDPGKPSWKEFDIAAFKEALKSLNQFNQKTAEREKARLDLEGRIAFQLGHRISGWKPNQTDSGEEGAWPEELAGEHRFTLVQALETELSRDLNETGDSEPISLDHGAVTFQEAGWKIARSSLRGFRDLAKLWNQAHKQKKDSLTSSDLEAIVKEYQGDEKNVRSVGSLPLFFALCQPGYWPLWVSESESEGEPTAGADDGSATEKAGAMLFAMADFHEQVRDYRRACEPINLTPAEPRHSRRLYMFSDITDKMGRVSYGGLEGDASGETPWIQTALVVREGGKVGPRAVRLGFTAPRLHRDHLAGGAESRWLQPMMEALGFDAFPPGKGLKAVSLMPDFDRSGESRHLLNFPVDLDASGVQSKIGKANRWASQFHGFPNKQLLKDKKFHLHWPTTIKDAGKNYWWNHPNSVEKGFTVLATDLGQRTAGAWSLVEVGATDPRTGDPKFTRLVREIGSDGDHTWFGTVRATGMHRLPGEDAPVLKKHGTFEREAWGKAGRNAKPEEWEQARQLAARLLADAPEAWVGATVTERSHPEQNDSLIALANRRLTRLNTFHRWSCFDPDREEVRPRRATLIGNLRKELEAWRDEEVRALIPTLGDPENGFADGDPAALRELAGRRFIALREGMRTLLLELANRVAPLRDRSWVWKDRGDGSGYGQLVDEGDRSDTTPWIRGQRGLSIARIEQLENLRRLFLRYNRSLDREPGAPAKFGRADRGRDSGEPCPLLLEKIDAMKEQRVNQTAHLILAQALGVRLKSHDTDGKDRRRRDLHGEYERIPGREPVDMIVIENLDRYLTSQGRAPSENSRLMKWAHRAVRDKLKMMAEEVFGIPVVETAAAYSSRFSAKSGVPGARAVELPGLPPYLRQSMEKKATGKKAEAAPFHRLLDQFARLEAINAARPGKKPRLLLHPRAGGPLFLSLLDSEPNPVQADINAATNLAFRAIAAPDRLDLLHRLRTVREGEGFRPLGVGGKDGNQREKAAHKAGAAIRFEETPSEKKKKESAKPNFFSDVARLAEHNRAILDAGGRETPIAPGVALWGTVNRRFLDRILAINEARLSDWGAPAPVPPPDDVADDDDAIPGLER